MTTRWEVEDAVNRSDIEPPGRHIVLALLTKSVADTAEIPPKHAPTFTELERLTGYSRSTLVEWMQALMSFGWVRRMRVEGESREGLALSVGDRCAARAPRQRTKRAAPVAQIPAPRTGEDIDGAYRQAVRDGADGVSPGGMERIAWRHGSVSPGDTDAADTFFKKNSPTESSLTMTPLTPPLFAGTALPAEAPTPKPKTPRAKKEEPHREDVERICKYLADAIVAGGSARPTVSAKWRTEARLLLDADRNPKATPERVTALIDWIQTNDWWKAKILSMPKLRAKYDEIRLDAFRDYNRKKSQGIGVNGERYANRVSVPTTRITNSHDNVDRYDALI